MNMANYIAFSLWGEKPLYTIGAIRNAELAKKVYPGWKVMVYHNDSVPLSVLDRLKGQGAQLVDMSGSSMYGAFWRFLAADIPDCAYAIFRDTDSRLSERERKAVEDWMKNGDAIHVMRDHPYHEIPYGAQQRSIMAGMWGIKGNLMDMQKVINDFIQGKADYYGIDQAFLEQIHQNFEQSQTVHDEFFEGKPFPAKRKGYRFVGERIDEYEQPVGDDWIPIKQYEKQHHPSFFRRLKMYFRG